MTDKRNANFIELFVSVTKAITSSLEPDNVFRLITEKIPQIVGVDAATIRLLDKSGKKLELRAAYGLSEAYLNRGTIDTEESIFKALRGEPITIENARQDARILYPEATRQEGIEIVCELDDQLPEIYADRTQVGQVLVNLVKNAMEVTQGAAMVKKHDPLAGKHQ